MFKAVSTHPPPRPRGTAIRQNQKSPGEREKPNRAAAVMQTLAAVTAPVPKRRIILPLTRLETMVQQEIRAVTQPARETGNPNSV